MSKYMFVLKFLTFCFSSVLIVYRSYFSLEEEECYAFLTFHSL